MHHFVERPDQQPLRKADDSTKGPPMRSKIVISRFVKLKFANKLSVHSSMQSVQAALAGASRSVSQAMPRLSQTYASSS
jgi:hypothetical protein